jgi:hypothetical protein
MKFFRELKMELRARWLLSETLVVVLGVLIALGLNDFWTERQERTLELQYIKRIHEDVSKDAEVIDSWFGEGLQKKLQALDAIVPIVRGIQPVPEDVENFFSKVVVGGRGGPSATRWVTSTTIEDLKSTGNLRLIRDVDLRRNIARYYHDMEGLFIRSRDRRTGYTAFVFSQLPMKLGNGLDEELNLTAIRKIDVDRSMERFVSIEFQELLTQEYNLAVFRSEINNSQSKQLAKDLEKYIQKLGGSI